jgi:hypothetical protein
MRCNIGVFDRLFRAVAGTAILTVAVTSDNWWGLLGFVPILTAISGHCPIYGMIKRSTCSAKGRCICGEE